MKLELLLAIVSSDSYASLVLGPENLIDTFLKTSRPSRLAYKILVERKQKSPIDSQRKWTTDCMLESDNSINWKVVYRTPFLAQKFQN